MTVREIMQRAIFSLWFGWWVLFCSALTLGNVVASDSYRTTEQWTLITTAFAWMVTSVCFLSSVYRMKETDKNNDQ